MKKNKQLSWLIISAGIILAVLILLSDTLRGREFYFGGSQIVMMLVPLLMIIVGWLIGHRPQIIEAIGKMIIPYVMQQLAQIKEQITRKNILLLSVFILLFSVIVVYYYSVGVPIVRAFPDYIGSGSTVTLMQLVFILIAALVCILPNFFALSAQKSKWINAIISVFIFFTAFTLWTSLPIAVNWLNRLVSSDPLVIYPFSDPRTYDINVLALLNGHGYGFGTPIKRPFYTFFWAILHLLFNHNHADMIFAQVVVFSVIPVMAFHLGNKFGGRVPGVVMAGMIIFHEYNQIILSSKYTMITVQMVMSELFIGLFIIILTYLTMLWFNDNQSIKKGIMAGTALGLIILSRTQAIVFLGVFLIYFIYAQFWKKEKVIKAYLFFLLSFALILTPWMTRNYLQNGYFSMDNPAYLNDILYTNGNNQSLTTVDENTSLSENVKTYIFAESGGLIQRTFAFLSNDIANSLYQFPWTTHFKPLEEYIDNGVTPFPHPYDRLNAMQMIVAGGHVLIIFIGLLAAMQRFQLSGLLPIFFYFTYCLSGDVLGYTAHRFIQPVEWIFFLYWGVGFSVLLSVIFPKSVVLPESNGFLENIGNKKSLAGSIWIGTAFLIAILVPSLELLIPQRDVSLPDMEKVNFAINEVELAEMIPGGDPPVMVDNEFTALNGFALYPLHLENASDWYNYYFDIKWYEFDHQKVLEWNDEFIKSQLSKDVDILLFQLMNDSLQDIMVEEPRIMGSVENPFLFNDAEAFVYGCVRENYIEAYYVQIVRDDLFFEITSGKPIPVSCRENN